MDHDPSMIPIQPIPFEHGLARFAHALEDRQAKIVAIGSSTTSGRGGITPYPSRLKLLLEKEKECKGATIAVINKGAGGEEAPKELERFATDVLPENPDLVIWQVGTNAVWRRPDSNPPPPSFDKTVRAIRDGLGVLRHKTDADVILMDLQYVPAVLTPAKKNLAIAMVEVIAELARDAGVNVFRRFAFMKSLHEIEGVSFDRMVDLTDNAARQRLGDGPAGLGGEACDRRRRQQGAYAGASHQLTN